METRPASVCQVPQGAGRPREQPASPWPALLPLRLDDIPVLGPTQALRGRPEGSSTTGWQLAQRAWEDSGVVWEESAGGRADADGLPPPPSPVFAPASPFAPSPAFAFTPPPLNAPVAPSPSDQEELFLAWQGSVDKAAGRRTHRTARRPARAASRRNRGWQVAKIGVPAAVIVTVGAGALMMLTGRANEMLAGRASSGVLSPGKPARGPVASRQASAGSAFPAGPGGSGSGLTLAGYPAGHGTVGVAALWSAGETTVAVGSADGHPAVWRHAADGTWSLVSAAVLGEMTGNLTSVTRGPSGWIAVGSVNANGTVEPAVFGSVTGTAWQPLAALAAAAGSGARFLGAAAGPGGYLVVGTQGTGRQASVALWWSNDLKNWVSGEHNGPPGSFAAAAAATAGGFVAVGSENDCHTLWTSPDGRHWTVHDLAKPPGATTATLTSVAAGQGGQADRFVAAGVATTSTGDLPIVVTAANDGTHISQTVLSSPDGPAAVTAVTAAAGGFVAAGEAGQADARRPVTWSSTEGRIWTPPAPLRAAGAAEVTALTTAGAGTALTATAQQGAASALLTFQAP